MQKKGWERKLITVPYHVLKYSLYVYMCIYIHIYTHTSCTCENCHTKGKKHTSLTAALSQAPHPKPHDIKIYFLSSSLLLFFPSFPLSLFYFFFFILKGKLVYYFNLRGKIMKNCLKPALQHIQFWFKQLTFFSVLCNPNQELIKRKWGQN